MTDHRSSRRAGGARRFVVALVALGLVAGACSKKDDDEGASPGAKAAVLILTGIGLLALHVGSQVLDQPDLRAWQVLPDRVSVARMRLPVGEHVIEVTRDGESYSLGAVTVRPGSVTVLVKRWFPVYGAVVAQQ